MNLLTVVWCILLLISCAYGIYLSYRLYHDFKLKYTFYLHYYVALNSLRGLLMFFMSRALEKGLLSESDRLASFVLYKQFQFLMLPAAWFFTYLFAMFVTGLIDSAPGKKFRYYFTLYGLVVGSVQLVIFNEYTKTGSGKIYGYFYWGLVVFAFYLVKAGFLWNALRRSRSVAEAARRKMVRQVVLAYIIMLTSYYILLVISQTNYVIEMITPFVFFLVNILPMLYAGRYLNRYQLKIPAAEMKDEVLELAVRKYGISRREKEIVKLIVKGKSNREIEDLLFISEKTVKNHVYNIFKKTSVHSRTQLINHLLNMSG